MDLYCHAQIVLRIVWFCESVCGNGLGVRICDAKLADYCVMTRDLMLLGIQMTTLLEICRIRVLGEMETRGLLETSVHID